MRHVIVQLPGFAREAKRAGLSPEDLRLIELDIMEDPEAFPLMAGTGGPRKMRFSPESRRGGKSGGVRVCYFLITPAEHVYLVTVFSKNDKPNLSPADAQAIAQVIARVRSGYRTPQQDWTAR